MIPQEIEDKLRDKGNVSIKDLANGTGLSYKNLLLQAHHGKIPCRDVSSPNSSRKAFRMFRSDCEAYFAVSIPIEKPTKPIPIPSSFPQSFDKDGNYIGDAKV